MKNIKSIFLAFLCAIVLIQCVDREFEIPELNGESPEIPEGAAILSVSDILDNLQLGTSVALPANSYLKGVVVGDDKSGNIYKTLFIQDESAGIALIIDETDLFNTYFVGREVFVKLDNLYIGDFNNLPQIGMAPDNDGVTRIPSALVSDILLPGTFNNQIEPVTLLLGQVSDQHLNMLVKFENVEFPDSYLGDTYATAVPSENIFQSENIPLENCDGASITIRSSGFSSFANTVIAEGNGTLYGVLGKFGTGQEAYQITLRDLGDVQLDGERCDGSEGNGGNNTGGELEGELVEDFEGGADNQDVSLDGWINVATKGTRVWRFNEFDGNLYIQATAYNDEEPEMETYLITPELDFDALTTLSFRSATAFYTHGGLDILFSSNFTGDVNAATWDVIDCALAGSGQDNYDWVDSGSVDLSAYNGKGHVAFRYSGSGPGGDTNTMILDDIAVE